jgi:hypothetical protein
VNKDALDKVSRKVTRQFPEMKSVHPTVRSQSKSGDRKEEFLLVYKGNVELPGGRKMSRVVRVVADEKGNVVRMSTSK